MPGRWSQTHLADYRGPVRFRRPFGRPGNLNSQERVWLTFAGFSGAVQVWLNGQPLGFQEEVGGPLEYEVTSLLGRRNELTVEMNASGEDGKLWDEVALEIRCTAFLRGLRAWIEDPGARARLHVAGTVVGTAERSLDLYLLLENRTAYHQTVLPEAAGRLFHVTIDKEGREGPWPDVVRLELVDGTVVWDTKEIPL